MSRAFVKELDDEPRVSLPEPRAPAPVTLAGYARLQGELQAASSDDRRAVLQARLAAAVPTGPPSDRHEIAFGASVVISGVARGKRTFTIVGEDEVDVERGAIGAASPLAQALLGGRTGDVVVWHRPGGDATVRIHDVRYDDV